MKGEGGRWTVVGCAWTVAMGVLTLGLGCSDGDAVHRLKIAVRETRGDVAADLVHKVRDVNEAGKSDVAVNMLDDLSADARSDVRCAVVQAMEGLQADASLLMPRLLWATFDTDSQVRTMAAAALANRRLTSEQVVGRLIELRQDSDADVRRQSIVSLATLAPPADAALDVLLAALQDDEVAQWGAAGLRDMGPAADRAVASLSRLGATSDGYPRLRAGEALWRITGDPNIAGPPLIACLDEDEFLPVRIDAARLLAEMGTTAREASGRLVRLLRSDSASATDAAGRALGAIGQDTLEDLSGALSAEDITTRRAAVRALAFYPRDAIGVDALLIRSLADESWVVRAMAADVIGVRAATNADLKQALRRTARDSHALVRTAASGALDRWQESHPDKMLTP